MPNLLAGLASLLWGTSDFLGGLAVKDWSATRFGTLTQLVGLAVVAVTLSFFSADPSASDLWWGVAAGVATAASLVFLYRSLATGPMNVAAPTAAVVGAVVPVVIGLSRAIGRRRWLSSASFSRWARSHSSGTPGRHRSTRDTSSAASSDGRWRGDRLGGGCFAQTSAASGVWPFGASKLVSAVILATVVVVSGRTRDGPLVGVTCCRLAVGVGDSVGDDLDGACPAAGISRTRRRSRWAVPGGHGGSRAIDLEGAARSRSIGWSRAGRVSGDLHHGLMDVERVGAIERRMGFTVCLTVPQRLEHGSPQSSRWLCSLIGRVLPESERGRGTRTS